MNRYYRVRISHAPAEGPRGSQGFVIQVQSFKRGKAQCRLLRGLEQVIEGLLPLFSLVKMVSEDATVFRKPVRIDLFDQVSGPSMQLTPLRFSHRVIRHLVDESVFERIRRFREQFLK